MRSTVVVSEVPDPPYLVVYSPKRLRVSLSLSNQTNYLCLVSSEVSVDSYVDSYVDWKNKRQSQIPFRHLCRPCLSGSRGRHTGCTTQTYSCSRDSSVIKNTTSYAFQPNIKPNKYVTSYSG